MYDSCLIECCCVAGGQGGKISDCILPEGAALGFPVSAVAHQDFSAYVAREFAEVGGGAGSACCLYGPCAHLERGVHGVEGWVAGDGVAVQVGVGLCVEVVIKAAGEVA